VVVESHHNSVAVAVQMEVAVDLEEVGLEKDLAEMKPVEQHYMY
jgi:hypothetical protein